MERLTEKMNDSYIDIGLNQGSICECIEKLGKLEDIEQELGIPLEVLFKALKDGIYRLYEEFEDEPPYIYFSMVELGYDENKEEYYLLRSGWDMYFLKDYGVTWALTREELEDVKD